MRTAATTGYASAALAGTPLRRAAPPAGGHRAGPAPAHDDTELDRHITGYRGRLVKRHEHAGEDDGACGDSSAWGASACGARGVGGGDGLLTPPGPHACNRRAPVPPPASQPHAPLPPHPRRPPQPPPRRCSQAAPRADVLLPPRRRGRAAGRVRPHADRDPRPPQGAVCARRRADEAPRVRPRGGGLLGGEPRRAGGRGCGCR